MECRSCELGGDFGGGPERSPATIEFPKEKKEPKTKTKKNPKKGKKTIARVTLARAGMFTRSFANLSGLRGGRGEWRSEIGAITAVKRPIPARHGISLSGGPEGNLSRIAGFLRKVTNDENEWGPAEGSALLYIKERQEYLKIKKINHWAQMDPERVGNISQRQRKG